MKCAAAKKEHLPPNTLPSYATIGLEFTGEKILYTYVLSTTRTESGRGYNRQELSGNLAFGTVKPLKDITLYSKLIIPDSNGLAATFRVGEANNSSTAVNTATVLQSSLANNMELLMGKNSPYLVLGNFNDFPGYSSQTVDPGNVSINTSSEITEIWLE